MGVGVMLQARPHRLARRNIGDGDADGDEMVMTMVIRKKHDAFVSQFTVDN